LITYLVTKFEISTLLPSSTTFDPSFTFDPALSLLYPVFRNPRKITNILPSYVNQRTIYRSTIYRTCSCAIHTATINPYAFKLQHLLNSKHQYAHNINASTKKMIALITQSAKNLQLQYSITLKVPVIKESFHADLELLATSIFKQASSSQPAPNHRPRTLSFKDIIYLV